MGHFYIPFASRLFELGEGSYDVAVLSHAGHSPGYIKPPPPVQSGEEEEQDTVSDKSDSGAAVGDEGSESTHRDWFNLEDQIEHKLAYIREHASDKDSLYLVGHSIGSWMVLQLMKRLDPSRVKKILLLFPTIEKMGTTPNGIRLAPLFTSWRLPFTACSVVHVVRTRHLQAVCSSTLLPHYTCSPP